MRTIESLKTAAFRNPSRAADMTIDPKNDRIERIAARYSPPPSVAAAGDEAVAAWRSDLRHRVAGRFLTRPLSEALYGTLVHNPKKEGPRYRDRSKRQHEPMPDASRKQRLRARYRAAGRYWPGVKQTRRYPAAFGSRSDALALA